MGFFPKEADFVQALVVSSVALVVFVTLNLAVGRSAARFPSMTLPSFTPVQRRAWLWATLLAGPLVAYSIYSTRNGVAGERVHGIWVMTNSTGYVNDAQLMAAPLLAGWLVATRFHWLNLPLVLLYVGYRSFLGWSRWTILLFFLMVVLAYCWYYRRKWLPLWSIGLAVPVLILFNILGHNRGYFHVLLIGEQSQILNYEAGMSTEEKNRLKLDTQDFANFDYLTFILSVVPSRTGTYTYAAQYLQLFTEPIPRILWKGKPVGAPVRTFNINAYGNFTGLTFSLVGDGWCNGGWVGLILTLGAAGALLGLFHRWFWHNQADVVRAMLYLSALSMTPQWFRDGGISLAKFMLWTWLPMLLWFAMTWVASGMRIPSYSLILRPGTRARLVQPDNTPSVSRKMASVTLASRPS
jgi:hypothetical protein